MKAIPTAVVMAALGLSVLAAPQAQAAGNVYSNQNFTFGSFYTLAPLTFSYQAATHSYTGTQDVTFEFLKPGGGFTSYNATLSVNFMATKTGASKTTVNPLTEAFTSASSISINLKKPDANGKTNILTVGMSPILSGAKGGTTATASGHSTTAGQTVKFSSDYFVTPAKNVNNSTASEGYALSLANILGWGETATPDTYFATKLRLTDNTANWSGSFSSTNVSLLNLPANVAPAPEAGSIVSLAMLIPGGLFLMRRRRTATAA